MNLKIKLSNVELGYQDKVVLQTTNLNFLSGKINLIVGNNGEGKTTLLKTLSGVIQPVAGDFNYLPADKISYLSTEFNFNDYKIKGSEYINLLSAFNNFKANDFNLDFNLLRSSEQSSMLELSSGMRQLLRLKSLCSSNKIFYIWDEPMKSLAPEVRELVAQYLNTQAVSKLVIVTDHSDENWRGYDLSKFKIQEGKIFEYF